MIRRLRKWWRLVKAHDHGGWGDLTPRRGCYCQETNDTTYALAPSPPEQPETCPTCHSKDEPRWNQGADGKHRCWDGWHASAPSPPEQPVRGGGNGFGAE